MEMQQIIELLAEMKADRKAVQAKAEANQEEMLARMEEKMNANMKTMQEKPDTTRKADREELKGMINAFQEKMDAWIVGIRDDRKKRTSCQEKTEARLECEDPISADMKFLQETATCYEAVETDTEKI
jgi:hypothetical protein